MRANIKFISRMNERDSCAFAMLLAPAMTHFWGLRRCFTSDMVEGSNLLLERWQALSNDQKYFLLH